MNFSTLIDQLNHRMLVDYVAVNFLKNPISVDIDNLGAKTMGFVLEQYSLFSKNISSFLLDAHLIMAHEGWTELAAELTQNINEEFGHQKEHCLGLSLEQEKSVRLPHYVLLRRGLKEGLGVDVALVSPSAATTSFIFGIKTVMNDLRPDYVAGGAYALESSAVPELQMVYGFAKRLFSLMNRDIPRQVSIFFESHIDELEVGHEQRLKQVCGNYIKADAQRAVFEDGFLRILSVMDDWWLGLLSEIHSLQRHAA